MPTLLILSHDADEYEQMINAARLAELALTTDPSQADIVLGEPKRIQEALPHLTKKEVFWRLYLSFGLLAHAMGNSRKVALISGNLCDGNNMQEALSQIKAFAKAGLCAPSEEKKGKEKS